MGTMSRKSIDAACEFSAMRPYDSKPIICVVGPTASGKSSLAIRLAEELCAEVVSADSMQVYRGMDIGTGKIDLATTGVRHHCIDLVSPGEPYSAALFQRDARASFSDIESRGKRCILCGGTGFYIRAAIDGYEFPEGEQVGNELRDSYNAIAEQRGPRALWQMLYDVDPVSANVIAENDVKRVVRAFELIDQGKSYADQREKLKSIPQLYPATFIGLEIEPEELRRRIDDRVEHMVERGLVGEVESLLNAGYREGVTAPQAIGYKEIVPVIEGKLTLEEAIERIKTATHRYAKRQRTWFRKDKRICWVNATAYDLDRISSEAMNIIEMNQQC